MCLPARPWCFVVSKKIKTDYTLNVCMNTTPSKNDINPSSARLFWRVLFAVYTFIGVYACLAPVLTLAQHQLAKGQTAFEPFVGAVVLTGIALVIQYVIAKLFRFTGTKYVLSFFPSGLFIVLLTAFTPHVRTAPLVVSALLAIVWIWLIAHSRRQAAGRRSQQGIVSFPAWVYFFVIAFYMGVCSNATDTINYEVKTAKHIMAGDTDKALTVGKNALATSPHLTALRMYAMAKHTAEPGEMLFAYPLPAGGSEVLYFGPADSLDVLLPADSLVKLLGTPRSAKDKTVAQYFARAARRRPHSAARDYHLCGLLLDKDLKTFADELPKYYVVSDSVVLPKYYAQALILYQRQNPEIEPLYADPNVTQNYLDFRKEGNKQREPEAKRTKTWRLYGDTYWWYYYYGK